MAEEHIYSLVVRTPGHPDCCCGTEVQCVEAAESRLPAASIFLIWRTHHRTGRTQLEPWRAFP